jgi:Fe2+ or Zn2+ uptake regulation protein
MELPISRLFNDKKLRLTQPRVLVFETLKKATQPLSIVEITKLCPTVDTASIYRTVDLFTKLAIATIVSHGWKQRYELAEPFRPHHHHMRCNLCETLIDINSLELEQQVAMLSEKYNFIVTDHSFELNGVCQKCATHLAA